jgi:hypothetical protein
MDPIFWIPIGVIVLIAVGFVVYSYARSEKDKLDIEHKAEDDGTSSEEENGR